MKQLEPRTQCPDIQDDGLQARVHDPLWLLARQWQTGEFKADDAGSPVGAFVRTETSAVSRYRLGPATAAAPAAAYAPDQAPLEAIVERERIAPASGRNVRLAAQAGLHFARLLTAKGMGKYVGAVRGGFPVQPPTAVERATFDRPSLNYAAVMAQRTVDGTALYARLSKARPAGGALTLPNEAPFAAIAAADRPAFTDAATQWLNWYERQFSQPAANEGAWVNERMEYTFAVSGKTSTGEMALAASEYRGGRLDWHAFDIDGSQSLGATTAPTTNTSAFLPAPVTFRGMPSSRFWEMEEGAVNLTAVAPSADGASDNAARALVVSFALEYSNDWFLVPLQIDVGSLVFVRSLVVTNSFGEKLLVRHTTSVDGPSSAWAMFGLSVAQNSASAAAGKFVDGFFLPPALGPTLEAEPLEDVLLLRDEMANLAWAVERTVESAAARRLDRHEQAAATRAAPPPRSIGDADASAPKRSTYRLGTSVPEFWIPFLPVQVGQALQLRRGALPGAQGTGIQPLGRVLDPGRDLLLRDEEVPREGARITRSFQYARWCNGSTHVWVGRRKRPGRGEGSSGLRFDVLD